MDEQLRIILIIIVSVSIFGLITFVFVRNYLKNIINQLVKEDNSDQDFFSGIKICKKKRIGPARAEDNRPLFYKKDISLLARNGFDFETSKRIMDIDQADYLKIIKLL